MILEIKSKNDDDEFKNDKEKLEAFTKKKNHINIKLAHISLSHPKYVILLGIKLVKWRG